MASRRENVSSTIQNFETNLSHKHGIKINLINKNGIGKTLTNGYTNNYRETNGKVC